jgi:hypothetical protein
MGRAFAQLMCCLSLMAGCNVSASAQSRFEPANVGDWQLYEYLGHLGNRRPTGVPNMAETPALDGRKARLGIEECAPYSVYFRLDLDSNFNAASAPVISPLEKVVFFKIEGTGQARYPDGLPALDGTLRPLILTGGDSNYFLMYPQSLMRGEKLSICPTQDEKNPACLTVSLRGITATLKAICPKR